MNLPLPSDEQLRNDARLRAEINDELQTRFAPEDDTLRNAIARDEAEKVPALQISPLQGKLLQVLALTCRAQMILEIGALTGYSGVWLARGLPDDGRLISLEVSSAYAEMARATFLAAGVSELTEVRVGPALELLPTLVAEAPFDMIFIDADKANNPQYLDWAITLSRPGSLIIANNIVRGGQAFQTPPPDDSAAGVAAYTNKILEHPRLVSTALTNESLNGIDGFAISVVRD